MNEEKFYKNIGKNIKKYRKEYNKHIDKMTQEILAEKINTSVSFISHLECAKIKQGISINTIYRISKILNVPIHKLINGDEDEY